jgi:ABC-type sulfate transport system permease subunit
MVKLLKEYGDIGLAEAYMNCGQPDLDEAGSEWIRSRGYKTFWSLTSPRVTWGQ